MIINYLLTCLQSILIGTEDVYGGVSQIWATLPRFTMLHTFCREGIPIHTRSWLDLSLEPAQQCHLHLTTRPTIGIILL